MSTKTDWFEDKVINHFLRNTSFTPENPLYMALFSTTPGETSGPGSIAGEIGGSGYAREQLTFSAPSAGLPGATFNSSAITFKASGGAWSAVIGYGVVGSASGSTNMYYFASAASTILADGDSLVFAVGDIDVTED